MPARFVATVYILRDTLISWWNDAKFWKSGWRKLTTMPVFLKKVKTFQKRNAELSDPLKVLELTVEKDIHIKPKNAFRAQDVFQGKHTMPHRMPQPDIGRYHVSLVKQYTHRNKNRVRHIWTIISNWRCG